jgi:hypothetical protein
MRCFGDKNLYPLFLIRLSEIQNREIKFLFGLSRSQPYFIDIYPCYAHANLRQPHLRYMLAVPPNKT